MAARFVRGSFGNFERFTLALTAAALAPLAFAFDVPPVPDPVCVYNCTAPYIGPPQPTAKELRQQKEAKDLRDAAKEAIDKGDDEYDRGQYHRAIELYKEALEYDPDDREAESKLAKAEEKERAAREEHDRAARESESVRQLTSADRHSNNASATADKREASQVFDTNGGRGPGLAVPVGTFGGSGVQRPVVPPAKRTPAIAAMERQLDSYDRHIKDLDDKLSKLDPSKDAVEVAKVKQQKSATQDKKRYVTFRINEALRTPEQAPSAK